MTTTHPRKEDSVLLAFAELDRLERARADFAAAKDTARARLDRQANDIDDLRARFEAERPRTRARLRRADKARRNQRDRAAAEAIAAVAVAHRELLERYEADLAAKREQLAALEAQPVTVGPARRVLEWSVPAAATILVAFLGFTFLGEDAAEAASRVMIVEDAGAPASPEFGPLIPLATELPPAPIEGEETKAKPTKSSKAKPSKTKPKTKPKPETNKPIGNMGHSNPLIIGDFGGNPLG